MQYAPEAWKSLSHSERRKHVNKQRKKWKRKVLAELREKEQAALENDPDYIELVLREEERLAEEQRKEEAQRLLDHELWLRCERIAQEEFRKKREKEEQVLREREERERLIREEWEALQLREREEEQKREVAKQAKELGQERLREALSTEAKPATEPWHNPLAPDVPPVSQDYGTEKDSRYCAFFLKTGACRFKERCSKFHPRPTSSTTLLIPGMYSSLGFRERVIDERDQDVGLEYDEGDIYEEFKQFYEDVLPEFSKAGALVQFKVSCNYEPHLRGNVYAQYSNEEECARAYHLFNGRWYAQRQLSCEFCPVKKWKTAICGLFNHKRCPKGKHCNFLHVFRNPQGAFSRADRDLPPISPPQPRRTSITYGRRRSGYRSRSRSPSGWRDRRQSRSRSPSGRRDRRQSRSRSPSGRRDRRHSRSRSPSGWRDRRQSRSRSPSGRRDRRQSRSRSRSESRERRYKRRTKRRSRSRDSLEKQSKKKKRMKHHDRRSSPDSDYTPERVMKHKSKRKKHKHHHRHHRRHNSQDKQTPSPTTQPPNTQSETTKVAVGDGEEDMCANNDTNGTSLVSGSEE